MERKMSVEYLAGFVDADGCVSSWWAGGKNPVWAIQVVQTEEHGLEPLQAMQERWGGSLHQRGTKAKPHHGTVWCWKITGIEAAIALTDMFFFLSTKKETAGEALAYFAQHPKFGRILRRLGEPRDPYYEVEEDPGT